MPKGSRRDIAGEAQMAAALERMVEQLGRGPMAGSVSPNTASVEDRSRTPIKLGTDANGNLTGIYGIGNYGEAPYAGDD